jgi:hypothetical protein
VNRVLIGKEFVYFGGEGPLIPNNFVDGMGRPIIKSGIGRTKFTDPQLVEMFTRWVRGFGVLGYQGRPQEWIALNGR